MRTTAASRSRGQSSTHEGAGVVPGSARGRRGRAAPFPERATRLLLPADTLTARRRGCSLVGWGGILPGDVRDVEAPLWHAACTAWRHQRPFTKEPAMDTTKIREHMEVIGADGEQLGNVDRVE